MVTSGMDSELSGRVAIVTGGASGIGAASVALLEGAGATVVVADLLGANDGPGRFVAHDVASEESWKALLADVLGCEGRLDIMVNNAGISGGSGNIETTTVENWQQVQAINSEGVFLGCKYAIEGMKKTGPGKPAAKGSIVNISSIAGLIASDTMPAYNSSKAAVWMLSKSIALHCAKNRMDIRCNSIHPTFVDTPILDGTAKNHNLEKHVLLEKLARQIPLRKVGEPNDIADAVVYLASDESKFMTGAELKLDGGISAM